MTMSDTELATVGDIMTKEPHCVRPTTSIADFVALLIEHGVSAAPVLDDELRLVGIISKTDLVRAHDDRFTSVVDLMTSRTYSLHESTSIADAIAAMGYEGIHHAPVVDDSGAVTGMLSSLDLLRWVADAHGYRPAARHTPRAFDPR